MEVGVKDGETEVNSCITVRLLFVIMMKLCYEMGCQ